MWISRPDSPTQRQTHAAAHGFESAVGPNGMPDAHRKVFPNWANFDGDYLGYIGVIEDMPGLPAGLAEDGNSLFEAATECAQAVHRRTAVSPEHLAHLVADFDAKRDALVRKITNAPYHWTLEPSGEEHSTASALHSLGRRSAGARLGSTPSTATLSSHAQTAAAFERTLRRVLRIVHIPLAHRRTLPLDGGSISWTERPQTNS